MQLCRQVWIWIAGALGLAQCALGNPGSPAPQETEFFEQQIRPVLVERCYRCHSAQAEKLKGGLLLDSRVGVLKGGEGGPVVVPGSPEQSRLIEALRYANIDLQMPPRGKLSDQQVADFVAWVKMGVPWPGTSSQPPVTQSGSFDWETRRREHWAWQPITDPTPSQVQDSHWGRGPVDQFVLARLEKSPLRPAPPAERQTLLRRVYFDLIGLPPTPAELEAFLEDASPDAYEKVVDRLLASAQFGERWARHWLDLVRYAETLGHEFDYQNYNAWRYRDYVIRAFNADVPYNQFVLEHIAGDLLDPPRRHPVDGFNESVIATAFYWLGQRDHSPVDVRQHQAEVIDNQIDVLTKTFLGLTVACARCHDHKFDAIPTTDYYSLYGILSSSRYALTAIDPPLAMAAKTEQLSRLKDHLRLAVARTWLVQTAEVSKYLLAADELPHWREDGYTSLEEALEQVSQHCNVDPARLARWDAALAEPSAPQPGHPLSAWIQCQESRLGEEGSFAGLWRRWVQESGPATAPVVGRAKSPSGFDFTRADASLAGWFLQDVAFRLAPAGDFTVGGAARPVVSVADASALDSGLLSKRLQGVARSPTFTITNRYIHILAAGRHARINVPVDNFTMIRDPIYGPLKQVLQSDSFRWTTIDVAMWKGHRAYLEFNDISAPDPGDGDHAGGFGPTGWLAVRRVAFTDQAEPPASPLPATARELLGSSPCPNRAALAQRYQEAVRAAVQGWACAKGSAAAAPCALLNWLVDHELLDAAENAEAVRLAALYSQVEASISDSIRVPSLVDGTGLDENVFIRGNHKTLGEPVSRRFLQAITGSAQPPIRHGSGRLELAQRMIDAQDPFLARVMVNRVWLHLFGRGLVPTPDDFGVLGQKPTHPELLDWLANWYRTEGGWSTKKLIRMLVTSSTYGMSSKPADLLAEEKDPDNLLWHRMPVRRLEGEAIRDSLLALSGRLDPRQFGSPVPIHLTEFMDGRGRPSQSGPLDGAGRRSIYIEVRRNFVSPMMRAFDMPVPFTTVGRRTVSNVPAQSLILMNDPFVVEETRRWARRELSVPAIAPEQRIRRLYQAAVSRTPATAEVTQALSFLKAQSAEYGDPAVDWHEDERAWADFCQVLVNVKEFVFLQ